MAWPLHSWPPWVKQNIRTPQIHILLEQNIWKPQKMGEILHFLCPKEKGCSPFKTAFAAHCLFWSMGSYCRRLYGPCSCLGNRYILIIGDLFKKYIETATLPSIETTIISQVFLDKIVFRRGPPHRFLTDRGRNFTSKFMTQLCNDLNINKVFTSNYHP